MSRLTKKEAVEFTGLDNKTFENFFKNASEFKSLKRNSSRGRFYFDEDKLKKWKESYNWRTVELTKNDYNSCLDFVLAMHVRGYTVADFGSSRQREFGQKLTNWIKGQLGEIAVQKFFKNEFNFEVELDFEIRNKIVPQDIISVFEKGQKRDPKVGVGIKSSKPKNAFLVVGENEVKMPERRSQIYIYCRPAIPDDHLLRLTKNLILETVKNERHYSIYKNSIPDFENIPCEIAGWCRCDELERKKKIPGLDFEKGVRFVKQSGKLHRTKQDWENLINEL